MFRIEMAMGGDKPLESDRSEFSFGMAVLRSTLSKVPDTYPSDLWVRVAIEIIEQKLSEFELVTRETPWGVGVELCSEAVAQATSDTVAAISELHTSRPALH
jgi:hypothetical protein